MWQETHLDSSDSQASTSAANASGKHRSWRYFARILQELWLPCTYKGNVNKMSTVLTDSTQITFYSVSEYRQNSCEITWVVQKVCRVTYLMTSYVYHILSLFNIISCNWNALGPTFLQSSNSTVEEWLILLFQPAIFCAYNVFVISKFAFFHEFLQFRINRSQSETPLVNVMGDGVVRIRQFWWQSVLEMTCEHVCCPGETALHIITVLVFSPSIPFRSFPTRAAYSVPVMVLMCSRLSVSTVPSASQNTVPITLQAVAITRNVLGGDEQSCFQAMLCTLLSGFKWWSQVSSAVTNKFSLKRWSRLLML